MSTSVNKRGMTLIELLVAIAIAAIVSLAAYSALFSVRGGTAHVYSRMKDRERLYNVLSLIRKEVESIYYFRDAAYSGLRIENSDFYGKPASKLTFTAFFKEGVKMISYYVEEDANKKLNLIKSISDGIKTADPFKMIVLKDIEGFKVQVLDEGFDVVYDSAKLGMTPNNVKVSIYLKNGEATDELAQYCTIMADNEKK